MINVYFHSDVAARQAAQAMPAGVTMTEAAMGEPYHGRAWEAVIEVDPTSTRVFSVVLEVVHRYGGEVHQDMTTRPGGAPFMDHMPQSVIDRYEDEHPEGHTAARHLPETEIGPLYHGTDEGNAKQILAHGFQGNPDRKGVVYLTKTPELARRYAENKGGTPAVLRIERVHGVSGHEVGYMDPNLAREHGAHFQDKHAEVLVLDPSRIEGVSRMTREHS